MPASHLMISGRREEDECDRESETGGDKEARRVIESLDWCSEWRHESMHACTVNPGVTLGDNFTR